MKMNKKPIAVAVALIIAGFSISLHDILKKNPGKNGGSQ